MSRRVAILLFDDVEVLDFAGPFEVFSVAGRPAAVADAGLDRRARDLAVEAPHARHAARSELPIGLARFQIDLDDRPICVRNRRLVRPRVRSFGVGDDGVYHRAVSVAMRVPVRRALVAMMGAVLMRSD